MYEARQNKEKVSRRIDAAGGGMAKQRIKIEDGKKRVSDVPIQRLFNQVIQNRLKKNVYRRDRNEYDVEYFGTVRDFYNGSPAGYRGITGVNKYWAIATVGNENKHTNKISADTHEYHRGHMLAQNLGGKGDADNIFKQDGGQNTTGEWPSFEQSVAKKRDEAYRFNPNTSMTYRINLSGYLNYDQPAF